MLFRVFRETRGYTTSNLITTEGLMTWSSEVFRKILKSCRGMKKLQKPKTYRVLCVVFRSLKKTRKKCVYFVHSCLHFLQLFSFAYTTSKPSHHNHSIIPLSNHHTIIMLKSIELRNIYIFLYIKLTKSIYTCESENSSAYSDRRRSIQSRTLDVWRRQIGWFPVRTKVERLVRDRGLGSDSPHPYPIDTTLDYSP